MRVLLTECDMLRKLSLFRTIAVHLNLVILSTAYNPGTILIDQESGKVVQ